MASMKENWILRRGCLINLNLCTHIEQNKLSKRIFLYYGADKIGVVAYKNEEELAKDFEIFAQILIDDVIDREIEAEHG